MMNSMGSHVQHVQVTPGGDSPKKQRATRATAAGRQRQVRSQLIIKPRPLKARPGLNFDKIEELLDQVEGPFRL
jgi:hypothetical protein